MIQELDCPGFEAGNPLQFWEVFHILNGIMQFLDWFAVHAGFDFINQWLNYNWNLVIFVDYFGSLLAPRKF
jgi:hypothetical protein